MEYREIGSSGIKASSVGLGTWVFGGAFWGGSEDHDSIMAVQRAVDIGITLIDTAPFYGLGRAEEILGKALHGRRDEVVLATKCGLIWEGNEGQFHYDDGVRKTYRNLTPISIRRELEHSLRRLQTD